MRLHALILAIVIVVSGCLGGGAVNTTPNGEPPDAAWANGEGIDETILAEHHFEALRAAGSFTHNRTSTVAIDSDVRPDTPRPEWYSPPQYSHEQVNLDAGRFLHESVTVGHTRGATFISPEEDATRRKPCPSAECSWEYSYLERSEVDTVAQEIDRYRNQRVVEMMVEITNDWNFTYSGTTEHNGDTVHRYTARWTFDKPMHPFAEKPTGTGTLLVTGDGVIRRWETTFVGPAQVTVDGETRTFDVTQRNAYTFSAVGESTITRPDWVDRAKEKDQPPKTKTANT